MKKHKFSMFEVAVVLIIFVIIAGLLFPAFCVARENASKIDKEKITNNRYEYVVEIKNSYHSYTYYCDRLDQTDKFYVLTDNQDRIIAKISVKPDDRLIMSRNSDKKGD